MPRNLEAGENPTFEVRQFMNKNRGSQERDDCYDSHCYVQERTEWSPDPEKEGCPPYTYRHEQVTPVNPGTWQKCVGELPTKYGSREFVKHKRNWPIIRSQSQVCQGRRLEGMYINFLVLQSELTANPPFALRQVQGERGWD